jgi:hypothetical protein
MMNRRAKRQTEADYLEAAIAHAQAGAAVTHPLVTVVTWVRPESGISETRREETKNRMLSAFHAAGKPASGSGQSYADLAETGPHTATVVLPDGTKMQLADIEPITGDRARAIATTIEAATAQRVKWREWGD